MCSRSWSTTSFHPLVWILDRPRTFLVLSRHMNLTPAPVRITTADRSFVNQACTNLQSSTLRLLLTRTPRHYQLSGTTSPSHRFHPHPPRRHTLISLALQEWTPAFTRTVHLPVPARTTRPTRPPPRTEVPAAQIINFTPSFLPHLEHCINSNTCRPRCRRILTHSPPSLQLFPNRP